MDFDSHDIFGRTELLVGPEIMSHIRSSRVIIFGVGGVGSWCAEALVRSGIGHLTMVDSDTVAVSNINRQLPATTLTVGRPKVEVLAERFRTISPDTEIVGIQGIYSPQTADEYDLAAYDYVVDAIDSLQCKAALILHADRLRCRLFSSMGAALKVSPQKVSVAEFWKVQGCPLARALRNYFKRAGRMPRRKFQCVYSPEVMPNLGAAPEAEAADTWAAKKAAVNGTFMHATAMFGMMLAGLVMEDIYKRGVSTEPLQG